MTVVSTKSGDVRGADHDGVVRFAGIPYAAPPIGDQRYKRPRPPSPWEGTRDCFEFGPVSHQPSTPLTAIMGGEPEPESEDCLYLNIYTPSADDEGRAVMVWIHGGGFIMGSGSSPIYNAANLASRGDVVVVTINYRLCAPGFISVDDLGFGDGSHNAGILDQIAALEWVRDNISNFGGDPELVTVFGESAGAMSIGTLLSMPAAEGLFRRAILQSGASHNISKPHEAIEIRDLIVDRLGDSSELLATATPSELVSAQGDLLVEGFARFDQGLEDGDLKPLLPFQPVADGIDVPLDPLEAIAAGSSKDVDVMIGTTRDEWKLFALMNQVAMDDDIITKRLGAILGDPDGALNLYRKVSPNASPTDLFGDAVTDFVFRQPAIRLAEAQIAAGANVHHYLFSWASEAMGGMIGSCHALDVPFVFRNMDGLGILLGPDVPDVMFDIMQDSWIAFAKTGNPSNPLVGDWPTYGLDKREVMGLDVHPEVLIDPYPEHRELWEGVV